MNEQIIAASMDESAFRQLTAAFYRRVRSDDLLGPMYPENDWAGAEERLADFLCFRFLGHTKYTDQRGHPRLRMRHLPFSIGTTERDRWLSLMSAAMDECALPAHTTTELSAFFAQVADFMRNRPESGS
ncbi:MAG: Group 2 hemoglobin GlbO [Verrucomicrobiota bacterium]|jgi:hemoglobin